MRITPVPCLSDNYAYLVTCEDTGQVAVVDPSEGAPVLAAAPRVDAIWSTHHHHDHVGGNEEVVAARGVKVVVGHASDRGRIPGQTHEVEEGHTLEGSLRVQVLHIPGHTTGAVAYLVTDGRGAPAVFTGDTLFLAGCGRLFEGTPAMMHTSLTKLSVLEPETLVYCGHEYTASNLKFAAHVEPGNRAVADRLAHVAALRAAGKPTVPGTLRDELATNPFLRVDAPEIRERLGIPREATAAEALGAIRRAKDDPVSLAPCTGRARAFAAAWMRARATLRFGRDGGQVATRGPGRRGSY